VKPPPQARWLGWSLLVVGGLVAPFVVYPIFAMDVMCFALFASAFNLLLGYAGLLSFGHAAYFGAAGYVASYLCKMQGLPVELAILCGVATSTLLGSVIGSLAIRRAGIYFAMITMSFAQLVYFLAVQFKWTGGEDGLQGVPRGKLLGFIDLGNNLAMYYFVYAVFLFGFLVIHRTIRSPFGAVLRSIRENEPRALSLGYDVDRYKLQAFVISAALSGLAGSVKSLVFQLSSLSDVHWHMSGEVVLMTLLGGLGTVLGPSVGALIVVTLQHQLTGLGGWVPVITGAIFVLCVLAFRRGIVGEVQALLRRSF
jgi:branched-chain amino acid transport system permease protein